MRIVFRYLKPYAGLALLAVVLMTVEVVCDLAQPTLMAQVVDQGVKGADMGLVIRLGAIMLAITVVGLGGGVGCTVFASKASMNVASDLRSALFRRVQSFSFDGLDTFTTGSLVTRLTNDVVQVQNFVLMMLRIMVRAPLLSIGGIVMALAINLRLASILLAALPVLAAALAFVIVKGFPLFTVVQQNLDAVNTVMRENLAGVRVIKAFVRSDYEIRRFGDANDRLTAITMTASRIVGLVMPVMFLVMNLSVVATIRLGGIQVNTGGMQVGEVMAFITYMTQILFSLMMVAFMLMAVSRAKASADRITEVMAHPSEPEPGAAALAITEVMAQEGEQEPAAASRVPAAAGGNGARIDFEGVTFRYPRAADLPVLRGIDLHVAPGQMVGILGSTGCGKSTLVSLVPRFYDATTGRVLLDGVDVRDIPFDRLRGRIGVVPQDSILFSGTIRDNLRWGREGATDDEIEAAAEIAQATEFIKQLPNGYDTPIGQRGVGLSGGQKQRLCIARALVRGPDVLILDDATSSVDMGTEARIQTGLRAIHGMTILVIAQRVSSVLDADAIVVLDDGRVVGTGTHHELLASNEVYRDIYESQVGEPVPHV